MKLKTPEEYGYVVENGICLFQKGPLSQWWGGQKGQTSDFRAVFPFESRPAKEHVFNCCEQWMMTAKAAIMNDYDTFNDILDCKSPAKQKELGRKIKNFDPELWDKHKEKAVYYGNLWKFTQNKDLKDFLLSFPAGTIFAEAAPWDTIWGIGLGPENPDALDTSKWNGQNLLGKAIMRVQSELQLKQ